MKKEYITPESEFTRVNMESVLITITNGDDDVDDSDKVRHIVKPTEKDPMFTPMNFRNIMEREEW